MPNDNDVPLHWQRHKPSLDAIRLEWDKAEGDIKRAEQINDAVCTPAIKELRYAGRRLVDALAEVSSGDAQNHAEGFINDARLGCHRARHDAVDAATAKIISEVDIAFEVFGHDVVVQCYPDFSRLFEPLEHAKSEIARSRADRTIRLQIHQKLSDDYFPEIVEKYNTFQVSATLMRGTAQSRRRTEFRNSVFGYGGLLFGAAGILLAIYFWLHP